jgi:hypothetical protein
MTAPQGDANTPRLMASIRRLKAALAPEIPRDAVVSEIRKILDSVGMENLLADATEGYFAEVLNRARRCVEQPNEGDLYDRLQAILNAKELEAALLTHDPDEQPRRLRELMLEGPYRDVERQDRR